MRINACLHMCACTPGNFLTLLQPASTTFPSSSSQLGCGPDPPPGHKVKVNFVRGGGGGSTTPPPGPGVWTPFQEPNKRLLQHFAPEKMNFFGVLLANFSKKSVKNAIFGHFFFKAKKMFARGRGSRPPPPLLPIHLRPCPASLGVERL